MSRFPVIATAVAMALATASSAFAGAKEDVSAAYEAWDAAFNAKDAAAIASAYTEDAVLLPPSHEVKEGPQSIEGFFENVLASGASDHKLEAIRVMESGDEIIAAAKWRVTGGDGKDHGGFATQVFERQSDGSLKLALHTFN